ncbi:uncharacterized [Tachysurus ichikawai]
MYTAMHAVTLVKSPRHVEVPLLPLLRALVLPPNSYRDVFCMNRGLSEREPVLNSSTPIHWANSNIPAISEGGGEQREHPDSKIVRHSHGDI